MNRDKGPSLVGLEFSRAFDEMLSAGKYTYIVRILKKLELRLRIDDVTCWMIKDWLSSPIRIPIVMLALIGKASRCLRPFPRRLRLTKPEGSLACHPDRLLLHSN